MHIEVFANTIRRFLKLAHHKMRAQCLARYIACWIVGFVQYSPTPRLIPPRPTKKYRATTPRPMTTDSPRCHHKWEWKGKFPPGHIAPLVVAGATVARVRHLRHRAV